MQPPADHLQPHIVGLDGERVWLIQVEPELARCGGKQLIRRGNTQWIGG